MNNFITAGEVNKERILLNGQGTKKKKNGSGGFLKMMAGAVGEREKCRSEKAAVACSANAEVYGDYARAAIKFGAAEKAEVQRVSLESMLKEKYPRISYHVFDASSSYWRTRNDYPHHLLYRDNIDTEAIENWTPSGPNPDPLSPNVQRQLASIPPGSKAVIIHPKVQQRMEEEPDYAEEIMRRIESWFAFDVARNEAIIPGITFGMSQCVAIGEDGSIVNAGAVSGGPRLTKSGGDEELTFWEMRSIRFALYMALSKECSDIMLLQLKQVAEGSETAEQIVSAISSLSKKEAREKLADMMADEGLRAALGETIAGVSIDDVFEFTRLDIWGVLPAL